MIITANNCRSFNNFSDYYNWEDKTTFQGFPTISTISNLVSDEFGNVYFVSVDGSINIFSLIGSQWVVNTLGDGSKEQKSLSKIAYNNGSIFFVTKEYTLNGVYLYYISRFCYSNDTWVYQRLCGEPGFYPSPDSLATDETGKVYFIDCSGNVCFLMTYDADWKLPNTSWSWGYIIDNPATPIIANLNTQLKLGNNSLFFVNDEGHLARFYLDNGWNYQDFGINLDYPVFELDETGKVFYIGSDSRVWSLWVYDYTSVTGNGPLNYESITARHGTNLLYFDGQLFFVGSDGFIHVFYYFQCCWQNKIINRNVIPLSGGQEYDIGFTISLSPDFYNNLYYINSIDKVIHCLSPQIDTATYPYVYLRGSDFMINNNRINLKVTNYSAEIYHTNTNNNNEWWIGPDCRHCLPSLDLSSKDDVRELLINHMIDIKNLGFNAIRVCGIAAFPAPINQNPYYGMCINGVVVNSYYSSDNDYLNGVDCLETIYFEIIKDLLDIALENGLWVILLTGSLFVNGNISNDCHELYSEFLGRLAGYLKNHPALMAYDLYNEPSYFYKNIDKTTVCDYMKQWYSSIKFSDPYHMITVGNIYPEDINCWGDPAIISVDFISVHIYPSPTTNERNNSDKIIGPTKRVLSVLFWLNEILTVKENKAWIIGETAFPADDQYICDPNYSKFYNPLYPNYNHEKWGDEIDQDNYARLIFDIIANSGCRGFSWFSYIDCTNYPNGPTDSQNTSINACDNYLCLYKYKSQPPEGRKLIITDNESHSNTIKYYNPEPHPENFVKPDNYYNIYNIADNNIIIHLPCIAVKNSFHLKGTVVDENGVPVKNAVISAWSAESDYYLTFTKDDGSFDLLSDTLIVVIWISFVGKIFLPIYQIHQNTTYYLLKINCLPLPLN